MALEPGKSRQFLAAIIVNLSAILHGMNIGWSSPTMPRLQSEQTPVGDEPLSDYQVSWLNSIVYIASLFVLPICNYVSEKYGRKMVGYLVTIPLITCWILIFFATNFWHLFIARFCAGFGGTTSLFLTPIYVSEISGDSIRGKLGSIFMFSLKLGILLGYIIGAVLSYHLYALCALAVCFTFFVCFNILPETPIYLIRNKKIAEGTKSLKWLKNGDGTVVERELSRLQIFVEKHCNAENSVSLKDLFRDKGTIKAFIIALTLLCGQQSCGIMIVLAYTAMIFQMAGSSLQPNICAIIIGLIQIFSCWLSTLLMERVGRKTLISISCIGIITCNCILGVFFYLKFNLYDVSSVSWIPLIALSVFSITYCLGMGPVPFVVISEIFSSDISALATSVVMIFMALIGFIAMTTFPFFVDLVGLHGTFIISAVACLFTFIIIICILPETKGRSLQSIIYELNDTPEKLGVNTSIETSIQKIKTSKPKKLANRLSVKKKEIQ
ncbi:facilitated trehalose transporter Tret1-like [Microplitis mediator]|uniref:facilitated trehalose transporter Tret1-like n=1 Tax=Microplitis mediator TaxID=375433 RepID=UPI0025560571|nr:facilitated trehalose transporter Tret1-like [Microplitis mediator]